MERRERNHTKAVAAAAMGAAVLGAVLAGTANDATARPGADPAAVMARAIFLGTVEKSTTGDYKKQVLVVATTPDEWRDAMARLAYDEALEFLPGADPPGLDWSREAAVLVGMGWTRSDVEIHQAVRLGNRLLLDWQTTPVGDPGGMQFSAYHLVKIERWASLRAMALSGQAAMDALGQMLLTNSTNPQGRGNRLHGMGSTLAPQAPRTWGGLKALYR